MFNKLNIKNTKEEHPNYDSYNETLYNTLSKNVELPLINQSKASKLLIKIQQNNNASVSSSTGQFIESINSIVKIKDQNKQDINRIGEDIGIIKKEVNLIEDELNDDFLDDIKEMKKQYLDYLIKQKKENAKLQIELSNYTKDVNELQNEIYYLLGKINKLEKSVGIKLKGYTEYDENLLIGTKKARFIIKTEQL